MARRRASKSRKKASSGKRVRVSGYTRKVGSKRVRVSGYTRKK